MMDKYKIGEKIESFIQRKFKGRIKIWQITYFVILIVLATIYIYKLYDYQIIESKQSRIDYDKKRTSIYRTKANRGSIYTADEYKIAYTLDYYNINISPINLKIKDGKIENEKIVQAINTVIPRIETAGLAEKLRLKNESKSEYLGIYIDISRKEKEELEELLASQGIGINKVNYDKKSIRHYEKDNTFTNIIGFIKNIEQTKGKQDFINKGVYGVEHYYDDALSGKDGLIETFRAINRKSKYTLPNIINKKEKTAKKDGSNIYLTIDSMLQYTLDEVLENSYNKYEALSTMGIVMDVETGKILAMSSYPKPKNNLEVKNKNITDIFEPGSIFKPITIAAAMEEGLINKNTLIESDGYIVVKDRIIRDHDDSTKGILSLDKIVANSGNVAMVKIEQMMDGAVFYDYLQKFGLGEKTGVDISYETNYRLFGLKDFTDVRKSNVSFGQGIAMTQIQMITALNATINGGHILKPYVVDRIEDSDKNIIFTNEREVKSTILSEKTSKNIRELLENVVLTGTGKKVAIPGYRIGGKTGTAQKSEKGRYQKGKYYSSFYAFFPADKPKYSIIVTVDEPKGGYYAAEVALPVARELLDKIIKYKGILPTEDISDNKIVDNKKEIKEVTNFDISNISESLSNNIMPNMVGLSIKETLEILKKTSIKYRIEGTGILSEQSIEEGSEIAGNDILILRFK